MSEKPARRNEALRESWFAAAYEILGTDGYGGLKLAPLCKKLGVTTGSFYHSFDNWQDFTTALLDTWLLERTVTTVEIAQRAADPVERLTLLAEASSDLLHRTEAAIRVWAGVDDGVGAIQQKVDDGRYHVVHQAMTEIVGPDLAEQFTVWGLSTLIGFEMISAEHSREHLLWSLQRILGDARLLGKK
ncbi:TetR/AcrR family transcriptional regulator [Nocardioides stalactiti]|uniref:TetR/AcrR family transcriptional regulator n=1 Tax=Nocardioides stalactiti TaxID=2755356 RepID=UPI001602CB24|nr:TetR/AcrR family transcriptional regulator [Nocardioides stalactiti]